MDWLKETEKFIIQNRLKSFSGYSDGELVVKLNYMIKKYAEECVKASLEKASENAKTIEKESTFESLSVNFPTYTAIDEESITNPENIVLI